MQQDVLRAGPEPSQSSSLPHQIKIPLEFAKQIDSLGYCHKPKGCFALLSRSALFLGTGTASCSICSHHQDSAHPAVPSPGVSRSPTVLQLCVLPSLFPALLTAAGELPRPEMEVLMLFSLSSIQNRAKKRGEERKKKNTNPHTEPPSSLLAQTVPGMD